MNHVPINPKEDVWTDDDGSEWVRYWHYEELIAELTTLREDFKQAEQHAETNSSLYERASKERDQWKETFERGLGDLKAVESERDTLLEVMSNLASKLRKEVIGYRRANGWITLDQPQIDATWSVIDMLESSVDAVKGDIK